MFTKFQNFKLLQTFEMFDHSEASIPRVNLNHFFRFTQFKPVFIPVVTYNVRKK